MAEFPKLKTGAIAQYPIQREFSYRTSVFSFIDGHEQRWLEGKGVERRWLLHFDLLDEGEAASIMRFFDFQGGRTGHFSFEDPQDAKVYPDCSFEQDTLEVKCAAEGVFEVDVTIRENA